MIGLPGRLFPRPGRNFPFPGCRPHRSRANTLISLNTPDWHRPCEEEAARTFHTGIRTMTVYSINKRALEQATNANQATSKAGSAAADFAALLTKAGNRVGGGGAVANAEKTLGQALDRPVKETRDPKHADKPERAEARADRPSRRNEAKATDRAEKPEPRDQAPVKEAKVEAPAKADTAPKTEAAPQRADDGEQNAAAAATGQVSAEAAATDQPMVAPVVAAPIIEVQQIVAPVAETVVQGDVADASGETADQLVAANPDQQDDRAAAAAAAAETAIDPLAGEDVADSANTAAATKTNTHAQATQNAADTPAGQQAADMAEMLADTGAQLALKVSVTNNAQAAASQTASDAAASPLDLLLAQELAMTEPTATGQPAGGQANGQNGKPNPGVATAAQQVADTAMQNAMAANGKVAEAKPFAAALVAQMEAGQAQPATGQAQSGQAVTGLGAASGTQAASKAQAPQAAHAPRQPQATQQQVMDQVTVQITKQAKAGHDTIKVQLKPVELGQIEVKLDIGPDGRVTGVVTADNKDTLAMLQKDARGLEKSLEDAGFKADSGSMTFNLRENNQQANEGNGQGRSRRPRGVPTGIDATASGVAAQAQARSSGSRSGVDIQV
jgi:flagellar hook-length control protein FliK